MFQDGGGFHALAFVTDESSLGNVAVVESEGRDCVGGDEAGVVSSR